MTAIAGKPDLHGRGENQEWASMMLIVPPEEFHSAKMLV